MNRVGLNTLLYKKYALMFNDSKKISFNLAHKLLFTKTQHPHTEQ